MKKGFLEYVYDGTVITPDYFRCGLSIYDVPKTFGYPEVREEVVRIIMTDEYYDEYYRIQELEKKGEISDAFYTKLRQYCNAIDTDTPSQKADFIVSRIKTAISKSEKCLVFSSFLAYGMSLIEKKLKDSQIKFCKIDGHSNADFRKREITTYNKNDKLVMLITEAGAEGIDLKETRHVFLMSRLGILIL